jgi:HEAT repeat protein
MEWFEPENRKRVFLIGGGGLVLILIVFVIYLSMGGEPPLDPNDNVGRMAKYRQLGNLDALVQGAESSDPKVKAAAIQQLPYFASNPKAVEPIRRAVNDSNSSVRAMAIQSYPQFDRSPASLPWMKAAMSDPSAEVAKAATVAAAQTQGAWELVPGLIANLDHKDRDVRQAAASSLEQILGVYITKSNPKSRYPGYRVNDPPGSPNHQEAMAYWREWIQRPEVSSHLKEYWATHQWKGPK